MTGRLPRLASTDQGTGRVVLLVHGQPGVRSDWGKVAAGLASTNRVLVPDRPGYGRTGGQAMGMASNADALVGLLDEQGVDEATVVGHSFGGGVGLAMALRHGDRVRALVLVGSVGTAQSLRTYDRLLGLPVVGDGLAFAGWQVSRWALPTLRRRSTRLPPILGSRIQAIPVASEDEWAGDGATWRSFVTEQRALLAETPSLEARLSSVTVPTAVVAGRRDRLVPPRASAELAAAIPGAELVWVAGVGHLVPQEAPDVVVEIVRRYASGR
ncbi:MAG TPA: alpha/beta hydrolase [Acidimicrobiales bacterium]|nr:alpha/beta hydrolase [Acidimicrobiales bacterium]